LPRDNRFVLDAFRRWFGAGQPEGTPPDPRFSLANERTFLAWIRTGLALIGGGLAVAGFLPPLRLAHLREVVAIGLMVLGSAVAFRAIDRYARVERAMRLGEALPASRFPGVLALTLGFGGIALALANLR
jgi:inner membrane protein YidH